MYTFSQRKTQFDCVTFTHVGCAFSVGLFTKMAITSVQNQTVHLNADRLK